MYHTISKTHFRLTLWKYSWTVLFVLSNDKVWRQTNFVFCFMTIILSTNLTVRRGGGNDLKIKCSLTLSWIMKNTIIGIRYKAPEFCLLLPWLSFIRHSTSNKYIKPILLIHLRDTTRFPFLISQKFGDWTRVTKTIHKLVSLYFFVSPLPFLKFSSFLLVLLFTLPY